MRLRYVSLLVTLGVLLVARLLEASTVVPSVVQGNPNCNTLCSGCYSELKVEPPNEGTYSQGTFTVIISNATYKSGGEMISFDWSANIGVNAVIVKAGNRANVYEYGPAVTSDTYLIPPGQQAISHITFCYVVPQITVTVDWGATLGIDQPMIADWTAHPTEFTQPFGNLTVSVTATINYQLQIYYTVGLLSDFSPPLGAMPLAFEYGTGSGNWTSIPPYEGTTQLLPAPTGIGTNEHTYPMRVDLAQLEAGDRTAGDSITFEVHVMPTDPGI